MPVIKTEYGVQVFRPVGHAQLSANLKNGDALNSAIPRNRNPILTMSQSARKKPSHGKNDNPKGPKTSFGIVIFRTLLLILLYYVSSIGLTFYQKWLLKVSQFIKF